MGDGQAGPSVKLHLASFQAFRCESCGRCCRNSWAVEVEPAALAGIASSGSTLAKKRQGYLPLVVAPNGSTVTGRDAEGACFYLDTEGLCELHAELGEESKPLACQLYPYSLTSTPEGRYASLSFACPVALWGCEEDPEFNRGQLETLLAARGGTGGPLPEKVEVVSGRWIPWSSYRQLEAALSQRLSAEQPVTSTLAAVGAVLSVLADTSEDGLPDWKAVALDAPVDDFELAVLQMVCASLVALLELPSLPEQRQQFSQALQAGLPLQAPRHRCELPPLQVISSPDALLLVGLERYLANFLFGKALLSGTVVSRLLELAAGTCLIVYYSGVFEATEPSRKEAISRAFELVEAELLTHSRSAAALFVSLEATFCQAYGLSKEAM